MLLLPSGQGSPSGHALVRDFRDFGKNSRAPLSIHMEAFEGIAMRDCTDLVTKAQAGDREALGRGRRYSESLWRWF